MVFSIIVTFNGAKWIEKCIKSIINSTINSKIIAVDNGSTDGTVDIIRQKFPFVLLIETGKNLGFGKANNIGLSIALKEKADYVFLLNQDAWVEKNTIEKLILVAQNNSEYGIISPMHMNGKGTALDYKFSTYICPNLCKNIYSDIFINKLDEVYNAEFVNAAAWLITLDCIKKVGFFDPLFIHYIEDNDFLSRTKYHGFKIGISPICKIYHDREESQLMNYQKSLNWNFGLHLFSLKNTKSPFVLNLFVFVGNTSKQLLKAIIKLSLNDMKYP
jgi:GT2 family glycosyltransferase